MKRTLAVTCLAVSALLPSLGFAQFTKPDDAVEYRQSVMTIMSTHFGRMAAMVRGQQPFDPAAFQANASLLQTLSKLPWPAFGAGLEGGKARADVWQNDAGFKDAAARFQQRADDLASAAQSGDQTRIRAAFGEAAASCKACHDSYRGR